MLAAKPRRLQHGQRCEHWRGARVPIGSARKPARDGKQQRDEEELRTHLTGERCGVLGLLCDVVRPPAAFDADLERE